MTMTWATAEDFADRLLPYLLPIVSGRGVTREMTDTAQKPFRVKRTRKPNGRA